MGIYLNRNNDSFKTDKEGIFVDKSDLIKVLNKRLNTKNRFICITRARRFGKTVNTNMIDAYYSKGSDSHSLFDGLDISKDNDYETHLNKYNVIHLDMAEFYNTYNKYTKEKIDPNDFIPYMQKVIIEELYKEFPSYVDSDEISLGNAIKSINDNTGLKFIMLMDEWDAPLREEEITKKTKDEYIEFLRSLFKVNTVKSCFSLAYMTGIIPIKKVNNDSALNDFKESTMIDPEPFEEYYGFTKEEVQKLCNENNMNYEDVESWYDGYILGGLHIFNPNSVVECLTRHKVGNYWGKTASYERVTGYISSDYDGLKEDILNLLGGMQVSVDVTKFKNDIFSFNGRDDVLTLLTHLGYLGFVRNDDKSSKGKAFVPNTEVREELEHAVEDTSWKNVIEMLEESEDLLNYTLEGNEEEVCLSLQKAQRSISSPLNYNSEDSLASAILLSYYSAQNYYLPFRELPTGKGFADIVYIPKKNVDKPSLVIELKWRADAITAIDQIKSKNYPEKLLSYGGDILLVGISYNKEDKDNSYSCKIEKWKK